MMLQTYLSARLLLLCSLMILLSSCGGGSSGTGDETTNAQLLSADCSPLQNQNLADFGIPSVEGTTNANGGFTLSPDAAGSLQIDSVVATNSGPICLLVIVKDSGPFTILSFSEDQVQFCAVRDLQSRYPAELESICGSSSP